MEFAHDNAQRQRSFVLDVLSRTGWSQSDLAHRAGLDPSTLSRFLSAGGEGRALRPATLARIERATGLSFAGDLAPADGGFAEAEALPLADTTASVSTAVAALSAGRGNVDAWKLASRALEMAGYRPGDIVLVALDEEPVPGDVVCAQIYDWARGQAETVFRLYQPPYLVAATADPALLRPHAVSDNGVAIKGVVIHTLRPRAAE